MKTEIPCSTHAEEKKISELLVTKIENPTTNASRKIKKFSSLLEIKELLHVIDTCNQSGTCLGLLVAKTGVILKTFLTQMQKNIVGTLQLQMPRR